LAVGPSLLRALWHGMRCLTMSEIRRWDATHFNVSSRHFCSRSTSFPSALEVFHDYALYKFTIDIDIDIYRSIHAVATLLQPLDKKPTLLVRQSRSRMSHVLFLSFSFLWQFAMTFSKYWGDMSTSVPSTYLFGGDDPPLSPLSHRP